MVKFEKDITSIVLDLFYALPKQEQNKLAKKILSNLDSNELNNSILQNNIILDRVNYLNKELGTNYTSLDEIDWVHISIHQAYQNLLSREFRG